MPSTGKPLVVIQGPTAVGKTGIAIKLAQAFNGEIISADSRQIYRYMDIGTAKPTSEQQTLVPHHLLDVVDPDHNLSLAEYQKLAYMAIEAIHVRGKLPLLVGGTGQYITAVIEGWSIPQVPPNETLRTELEAFANQHGSEALHLRLHDIDPEAAISIDRRNVRRVVRALEVSTMTGKKFSELQRKVPPPYELAVIGLTMADRALLYARADQRVDVMMADGFLDEVRRLLDMGYARLLPSMSGLGYAQLAAHVLDNLALDEAVTLTKNATHDFIRRQYTWFRGHNHETLWHNVEALAIETLIQIIEARIT